MEVRPPRRARADAGAAGPIARGRALAAKPPQAEADDLTRDARAFTAAIRARVFAFLRTWWTGDPQAALLGLDPPLDEDAAGWTAERAKAAREAFRAEHGMLRFDPEARNARHTHVAPSDDGRTWRVQQMLIGQPAGHDAGEEEGERKPSYVDHLIDHRTAPGVGDGENQYVTSNFTLCRWRAVREFRPGCQVSFVTLRAP